MLPFKEINDAILVTLTPREEMVIRAIYIEQWEPKQVREYFGVGKNGIYYIRNKALRKIASRFSTDLGYPPYGVDWSGG